MPSILAERPKANASWEDTINDDDLSDNPFKTPSPENQSKKRKEVDALGLDEEVDLNKRKRAPNVKLDEERLLGPKGLPKLRERARTLKFKGKGHEFSDCARLLSFYQFWLDDLFPKAQFLDALAMVEKMGHKKTLAAARRDWLEEGSSKKFGNGQSVDDPVVDVDDALSLPNPRPTTPTASWDNDVPNDEDLYDATPNRSRTLRNLSKNHDVPEDDDLDALMAEAEAQDAPSNRSKQQNQPDRADTVPDDEDDLDALIAEAEAQEGGPQRTTAQTREDGTDMSKSARKDDYEDDEAAMREMDDLW